MKKTLTVLATLVLSASTLMAATSSFKVNEISLGYSSLTGDNNTFVVGTRMNENKEGHYTASLGIQHESEAVFSSSTNKLSSTVFTLSGSRAFYTKDQYVLEAGAALGFGSSNYKSNSTSENIGTYFGFGLSGAAGVNIDAGSGIMVTPMLGLSYTYSIFSMSEKTSSNSLAITQSTIGLSPSVRLQKDHWSVMLSSTILLYGNMAMKMGEVELKDSVSISDQEDKINLALALGYRF